MSVIIIILYWICYLIKNYALTIALFMEHIN